MKIYDHILQGHEATEQNAIDHAMGFVWQDCEQTEQDKPFYSEYVQSINGIDIYYDYGADYYFFTDTKG